MLVTFQRISVTRFPHSTPNLMQLPMFPLIPAHQSFESKFQTLFEADGFFQDVKILNTSLPGETLSRGSRV